MNTTNNNFYIIDNVNDIANNIDKLLEAINFNYKKPFCIFDIHKTTLNKYGKLDKDIYCLIKRLIEKKYNICFLSFDDQHSRILENNKLLNNYYYYKNIPKIFIKKRKKQLILDYIFKNVEKPLKIVLIDDNIRNINDVNNLNNKKITSFHYINNNNINNLYTFLKIKKNKTLTKKQNKYNNYLQNQIKINMKLFKKGKYKSKKQAIAISYTQTNNAINEC